MIKLFGVIGGLLVATVIAGWVALGFGDEAEQKCKSSDRVLVVIPKGAGVAQVAQRLQASGVIDGTTRFGLRVRVDGVGSKLHAGPVLMCKGSSYSTAIEVLTKGGNATKLVTIPEGPASEEVAPIAASAGVSGSYLAAVKAATGLSPKEFGAPSSAGLEGFLFPSTYDLPLHPTSTQLVAAQLKAFKSNLARVDMRRAKSKNLTAFDVVTIAAMVERETAAAKERPLVAAVIWNRLKQRIPLGIDATSRYEFRNWSRPLLASQLASQSQWNTRIHAGLPPGPIGNPGLASLQAAANPASSDALYYVVKPWACGEHTFTNTLAEFDRAVAAYNAARASNGGRAPTKCP